MKSLKKLTIGTSLALALSTSLVAGTYVVQKGDTLSSIVYEKLKLKSIAESGIIVPSGDINKIFPGDVLEYKSIKKRSHRKLHKTYKLDLNKFCFEDTASIHYKASEDCKNRKKVKKQTKRKLGRHKK